MLCRDVFEGPGAIWISALKPGAIMRNKAREGESVQSEETQEAASVNNAALRPRLIHELHD